jgi:hypothetical protein
LIFKSGSSEVVFKVGFNGVIFIDIFIKFIIFSDNLEFEFRDFILEEFNLDFELVGEFVMGIIGFFVDGFELQEVIGLFHFLVQRIYISIGQCLL